MGRIFVVELEGRCYKCKFCKTHLALFSDCVSRVTFFSLFLSISAQKIASFTHNKKYPSSTTVKVSLFVLRLFIAAEEKHTSSIMPVLTLLYGKKYSVPLGFFIVLSDTIKIPELGYSKWFETWPRRNVQRSRNYKSVAFTLARCSEATYYVIFGLGEQERAIEVNTTTGTLEERMMLSGLHTVADIFCCSCGQIVGWKYESAHENSQKYKEGKFVLERGRIVDEVDFSAEYFVDTRPSMSGSDADDA
ncbi:hypothetical protein C1H46_009418 [Malus baccata]|uniref:Yippee domain-containing protein n=1 Tax=Malus baccata TaxID=106549 RepID=A0A540N1K8_MALBA|nr:hypothetical protein C1H46_009418 [Malus baccata]